MIIEEYQLICENCGRTFDTSQTLSKHTESEHGSDDQTKCNQCEFKTHNGKDLASHLLDKHGDNTEDIKCPHCDYKSINLDNIHEHIDKEHLELTLLGNMTSNQTILNKNFDYFKEDLTTMINILIDKQNTIINGQNTIKQELFILKQKSHIQEEKISNIVKTSQQVLNPGKTSPRRY